MRKHATHTPTLSGSLRLDPAFHRQMMGTWHSFVDGLYTPALYGAFGPMTLIYVVEQHGVCPGFSTWQEARDFARAAFEMDGVTLRAVKEDRETVPFHPTRQAPSAKRSTPGRHARRSGAKAEVA